MRKMVQFRIRNGISMGRALSPTQAKPPVRNKDKEKRPHVQERTSANPVLTAAHLDNAMGCSEVRRMPVSAYLKRLTDARKKRRERRNHHQANDGSDNTLLTTANTS